MRVILISTIMAIFSFQVNALTLRDGDILHEGKTHFCASPNTESAVFKRAHAKGEYAGVVNKCFYYVWNQYIIYIPFNKFIHANDRVSIIKTVLTDRIVFLQNQTASLDGSFAYKSELPHDVSYHPHVDIANDIDLSIDENDIEQAAENIETAIDESDLDEKITDATKLAEETISQIVDEVKGKVENKVDEALDDLKEWEEANSLDLGSGTLDDIKDGTDKLNLGGHDKKHLEESK